MQICFIVIYSLLLVIAKGVKLDEIFSWNEMKYAWPSETEKANAIDSGQYIPENNLPLGLAVWKNKLFITVPRWKAGVAASLSYIELNTKEKSPELHPYPNWNVSTLPVTDNNDKPIFDTKGGRVNAPKAEIDKKGLENNATIISVFRVFVDECDRLWVMDTGLADILGSPKQITPPSIVIFDLNTNELIRRFPIPDLQVKEDTFFANIVVDCTSDNCDNAFAYIPDLGGYGLVVYSFENNKSWRIKHNYFHFDPLYGNYNVGGVNFQWTDGIFGLAVGKLNNDNSRNVYFHAFSSTKEFVVSNKLLQNETYATSPASYHDYELLGDRGQNGQATAEVFDSENDVIFYTQVNKDAICCWNIHKPYTTEYQGLVDSDSSALVFPNDIKIDDRGNLWVLSDKLPVFLYKELDLNVVNYRILRGKTTDLIRGTVCAGE